MPSAALPVSQTVPVLLAALEAAGVPAFFSPEERLIYAHPTTVTAAEMFAHLHVTVDWEEFDPEQPYADRSFVRATAEEPDGGVDFHVIGTVYETPVQRTRAEEAAACARAVAEFLHDPGNVAGSLLLDELAEYGVVSGNGLSVTYGPHTDTYDIPVDLGYGEYGRLEITGRGGSVRYLAAVHTGWTMFLFTERGEAIGEPVLLSGDGGLVDCAEDSSVFAAAVAEWLTSPVSRHCDCYANDGHGRRHDHACNRYRRP
ncbi:hypothetical protein ACWF9B_00500 [Streptomyces sp. NPDC055089]